MYGSQKFSCFYDAGQEKSIHAWVAANYVLGTLGTNPQDTTGIIELGGSSVQVIKLSS